MRVGILAVGRMKSGPERDLADRYFERFAKLGPSLGLEFSGVDEFVESRAGSADARKTDEAERMRAKAGAGSAMIVLDERGQSRSSEDFADRLAEIRDSGVRQLHFAIGGPDGHDPALRSEARLVLSFGTMTWPHQIARVMLAEQLYRAATILSGHPYHRV